MMDPPVPKWRMFGLVATAVFMATLDGSIVNLALPTIMADLKMAMHQVEWVMLIYLMTVSAMLLPCGRLSDIKGRRWVFGRGFALFTLGSLCCAMASQAILLIAARALQGLGAAMIMACSPAIIVDTFPLAERGRAIGMVGTIVATGLMCGPVLGGLIVGWLGWRFIFYLNLPIGIVATVLATVWLTHPSTNVRRNEPLDVLGALLLSICLGSILLMVTQTGGSGGLASSAGRIAIGAVIAFSLIGLVYHERRHQYPAFDLSLLKIRLFVLPITTAIFMFAGLFMVLFLMPFLLMHPFGWSSQKTGYFMMTPFIAMFLLAPLSGTIADRYGSRGLCTVGMFVLSGALWALSGINTVASEWQIFWRLILIGIGIALFNPPNSTTAMNAVQPHQRGIASGTVAMARNLGMVAGIAMAGFLFGWAFSKSSGGLVFETYSTQVQAHFLAAYQKAMQGGAVILAVGACVAFLRGSEKQMPRTEKDCQTR